MTPQSGPIGMLCRIYSILLYAYPRDFRLQYGIAMQQVFRDRCRDVVRAPGRWPKLLFATHIAADWLTTAVGERAVAVWSAGRKKTPRNFVTEWAVTIAIYLCATTTLVQAYVVPTGSGGHYPRRRSLAGGPRDLRRARIHRTPHPAVPRA
jgi:hypothetical protein